MGGSSTYLSFVRSDPWQSPSNERSIGPMTDKKDLWRSALIVAFAARAMAAEFPNPYATNADARSH
jgi:hypothetical protein